MADASDMILPMLREMRADNAALHAETRKSLDIVEQRPDTIEAAQKSFRQAFTADSVSSKLVTGEFEQRNVALEGKFADLEAQR